MSSHESLSIEDLEIAPPKTSDPDRFVWAAVIQQAYLDVSAKHKTISPEQMDAFVWIYGDQSARNSFDNVASITGVDPESFRERFVKMIGIRRFVEIGQTVVAHPSTLPATKRVITAYLNRDVTADAFSEYLESLDEKLEERPLLVLT